MIPDGFVILKDELKKEYDNIIDEFLEKKKITRRYQRNIMRMIVNKYVDDYLTKIKNDLVHEAKEVFIGNVLSIQIMNISHKINNFKYPKKTGGNRYKIYVHVTDGYYRTHKRMYFGRMATLMFNEMLFKVKNGFIYPTSDMSRYKKIMTEIALKKGFK